VKKIMCVLVLVCVIVGSAFAQEKSNAAALDLCSLIRGFIASDDDSDYSNFALSLAYEKLIAPHFSIGADIDLHFLKLDDIDGLYFNLSAEGRYYPMADFEKFFIGTTIGYNSLAIDGKTDAAHEGFESLIFSLKLGYKLIMKSIYLEPALSYVYSKSSQISSFVPTPLGWNCGLRLGFML